MHNNSTADQVMVVGRRNNAAKRLPLTVSDQDSPPASINAAATQDLLRRGGTKRLRPRCSYRSTVVAITATLFYISLALLRQNFFSESAAEPCQVARQTAESLKRTTQRRQEDSSSFPSDWKAHVPKIIHHQWKTTEIPDKYKEWNEKWYKLYPEPEYKHMLWTDESARTFVKEKYPWFLDTYDNYDYPIKRADAVRYFYLHHYGGIHTDLDYEPLSGEIFQHLPQDRVGLVESPYKFSENVQNSFMSSPKGDPFWLDVFELLQKHKNKRVLSATGPQLMDAAIQYSQHPIHILPCENFHRIPLHEKKQSPFITRVVRGILARLYPMKQCGNFDGKDTCHFAKHHNTAVYVAESSWWDLLVNM